MEYKKIKKQNSVFHLSADVAKSTCRISGSIRDNGLRKKKILKSEPDIYKLYEELVSLPMSSIRKDYGESATVSARKFLF